MNSLSVCGVGAVSPAGWSAAELCTAVRAGRALDPKMVARPGWPDGLRVRQVPAPDPRPAALSHGRLRRASPITHFAVAAALEAIGGDRDAITRGELRLGIIVCAMSGCVNYSRRFYDELLRDPSAASPLVFPETVFNAPASHLGALLQCQAVNYTLVGDSGMFLTALALAGHWLSNNTVDSCVVVGAEESDWLTADACRLFHKTVVVSDGAGALYLKRGGHSHPQLAAVTDAHSFTLLQSAHCAAARMRSELTAGGRALLCDGRAGLGRRDAAETQAWREWTGARLSPKRVLGEGLAAAGAWQCVVAIDALHRRVCDTALVSVVGPNQQAVGACFTAAALEEAS